MSARALAALLLVAACGAGPAAGPPAPVSAPVGEEPATAATALTRTITVEAQSGESRYAAPCVITETSIAGVAAPKTLGAFAASFPAGSTLVFEPLYMVDLGALCLVEAGVDKLCAYFFSYEVEAYDPAIEAIGLVSRDQSCRTAEGVGPGSRVSEAAKAYGAPRFAFNYDNEGREYVSFARAPEAYEFRAASDEGASLAEADAAAETPRAFWPNGDFGGDYRGAATGGDGYETATALSDAVIIEVGVR